MTPNRYEVRVTPWRAPFHCYAPFRSRKYWVLDVRSCNARDLNVNGQPAYGVTQSKNDASDAYATVVEYIDFMFNRKVENSFDITWDWSAVR